MARWGNCDYRQLQKLRENLDRLQSADLEKFCGDGLWSSPWAVFTSM